LALVKPLDRWPVTTLEAPDADQALGQIIASEIPFDVWYRERLQKLHGINLAGYEKYAQPTPIPDNQELLFEWLNPCCG
jgi:hypothetical protein